MLACCGHEHGRLDVSDVVESIACLAVHLVLLCVLWKGEDLCFHVVSRVVGCPYLVEAAFRIVDWGLWRC